LKLQVYALRDEQGGYTGPALSWEIITDQVRAEQREKTQKTEMARIQAIVEYSPKPVMLLDPKDFIITYANPASIKTLETLEKYLPCKASELIGKCVDIFHKNPSHQRKMLADEKNLPHDARIQLGDEWLKLQVYALRDENGKYTGPALSWEVITDQVRAEQREKTQRSEMARVQAIVEYSPKPVLLLDLKDMRITYANPAAITTLTALEQYLPCRASELVGQCVDIFHKNPSHQRRMLADERNLPHNTRIKLGPETLQLQVYALRDEHGKYVGPALAWEVITDRARLEEADARAKEVVKRVQLALEALAQGNVDSLIEETFEGDLEAMKNNVNKIATVLQSFREEARGLIDAARHGRLSERADAARFQGAYGEIIRGINSILDAILTPVANIREKLARVSEGDLTAYVRDDYEGDHAALRDALNASLDGLNRLLGQVRDAANQIATSAGQVSDASQDLSQGASEQAATIEEISAQMVQMTNQTHQNAENASQANQLAVAARDGAEAGDKRMTEMVGAMRDIEEASNNISKIIKVIDEIAFQTNLLALNAAVEAARAGVHGKGFAVVAEEVRNLAARSARAAKETTEMIEGSIKKVTQGTGIAKETATALNRIVQDVGKVTDLVAEIAAASNEQAEGIAQINQGLEQVNEVTQRNTATAEESAASAEEMSGQTSEMRGMVERFKLADEGGLMSPPDLPPDLADAVQKYIAQLMGKKPPTAAKTSTAQTHSSNGAARSKPTRSAKSDPESVIALDSPEYGKY
jgi:methyl-accepting chemotaxis protein